MKRNAIALMLAAVLCVNSVSISVLAENTDSASTTAYAMEEHTDETEEEAEAEEFEAAEEPQIAEAAENNGEYTGEASAAADSEEEIDDDETEEETENEDSAIEPEIDAGEEAESADQDEDPTADTIIDFEGSDEVADQNESSSIEIEPEPEEIIAESSIPEEANEDAKAADSTEFTYSILNDSYISITGYTGSSTDVVIPETIGDYPVQEIASDAFQSSAIETVRLPQSIEIIGSQAFFRCRHLKNIELSSKLKKIGSRAFEDCSGLVELKIPDGVTEIGAYALRGCSRLTALELPDGITSLGMFALENCTNLESVNYPLSLSSAGGSIFKGDTKLKRIEVPEGVTVIMNRVFADASNFTEIILPSTLKKIGNSAFDGCSGLVELKIPDGVTAIGDYAFRGCSSLKALELPDGLTTIGIYAFENCTNLESVNYPLSLDSVGGSIFKGDTKLKRMVVPEGVTVIMNRVFADASNFTEIILPSTLKKIGNSAFNGCSGLGELKIPDGVTVIGDYAFRGCSSLKALELPDGITTIGIYAFENCTNLESVNYPLSLSSAGGSIFKGDTKLKRMEVPEGVTQIAKNVFTKDTYFTEIILPSTLKKIGNRVFEGCTGLKHLEIPDDVTEIDDYAFSGCTGLTALELPSTLTKIGGRAFEGCSNLTKLYLPDSVESIDSTTFANTSKVVFYCNYISYATLFAIENNIPFVSVNSYSDTENSILDRNASSYYSDLNSMSANGYVSMTVQYSIKDTYVSAVSDMKINIVLPKVAEIDESTLFVDDQLCTNYTYDGKRTVSIPVTNASGIIKFSIKVNSEGDISSYALLLCKKSGNASKEIIGIVNESVPVFTIDVPDRTSEKTFSVSGVAPASSTIEVSVENGEKATALASKAGFWKAELILTNPVDYHDYKITAVCTPLSGTTETRISAVTYIAGEPTLKNLELYYNSNSTDKKYNLTDTKGVLPVIYHLPMREVVLEASFENADNIDELYFTSTRNNITKYLPAEYDAEKGVFVASGYFDEKNHNYVPGTISYEYNKKIPEVNVGQDVDWDSLINNLPEGAENIVNVTSITDTEYNASFDFSKLSEDLSDVAIDAGIKIFDANTGTDLGKWKGLLEEGDDILSYTIPGYNDEKFICNLDYSDEDTLLMLVKDVSGNKLIGFALDTAMDNAGSLDEYAKLMEASTTLNAISQSATLIYNYRQIEKDTDKLREEVMTSGNYSSTTELNKALKKVDELEKDKKKFLLMTTVLPMMVAAPVAIGATMSAAPAILFTAMLGTIMATSSFFWDYRKADIKGEKYKTRFIVDPSGIVYDIETGEFLEDVTTTAYWIENDDSEDFWDNKPGDSEYGTIWDAIDYNQGNPLLTNVDGKYAWDVPEGWWRVKFEKEGYVTAWSDWMTVPPIRTEVNIGLTPIESKKKDLSSNAEITGISDKLYTGSAIEQDITVKYDGAELTEGTDYTVFYSGNINAGTATVVITGIGSYEGTVTKTFLILPGKTTRGDMFNLANNVKVTWKEVPGAKYYKIYREGITNPEETRKEPVIVTERLIGWDAQPGLTNGHAYRYKIVASLTGKGDPSGDSTRSYSKVMYRLKTVVIRSVKNTAAGKVTVKYDKTSSGDSYVLQYCEREDMVGAKTKVVLGANNTSYTIGGLKKGKTYYISIRVRKKVNGIDYYTTFGVPKKIKITQ